MNPTLCEKCANAVPNAHHGCPWSERGEPVPGWTAEATSIRQQTTLFKKPKPRYIDSFCIEACPLFIPDEERQQAEPDPAGLERLCIAITAKAAEDYRNVLLCLRGRERDATWRGHRKHLEQFLEGGESGHAFTLGMGPIVAERVRAEVGIRE